MNIKHAPTYHVHKKHSQRVQKVSELGWPVEAMRAGQGWVRGSGGQGGSERSKQKHKNPANKAMGGTTMPPVQQNRTNSALTMGCCTQSLPGAHPMSTHKGKEKHTKNRQYA